MLYTVPETDLLLDGIAPDAPMRQYVLKIKDLPPDDKPREKLLKFGPKFLSLAELVAVILGNGTKKEDVMTMANRMIKEYGERSLAKQHDAKQLATDLDIPLVKAMQLVATSELGRRFFDKRDLGPAVLRTPQDVSDYLADMQNLPKEHLRGIYLNAHHRVIHDEVISIGTINTNLIHPREVFKPAIESGAVAVILAHNHPSGDPLPSEADIAITKQIVAAGKIIGIHVLDHIVIAKGSFMSIAVEY